LHSQRSPAGEAVNPMPAELLIPCQQLLFGLEWASRLRDAPDRLVGAVVSVPQRRPTRKVRWSASKGAADLRVPEVQRQVSAAADVHSGNPSGSIQSEGLVRVWPAPCGPI